MKFNIIGAGKLGINLAYALQANRLAQINAIYSRSFKSAEKAIAALGAGQAVSALRELPQAELTLITTSDDAIASTAAMLAENNQLPVNSIVAHCSGVLSAEALKPLKNQGCHIASIHPLKAFLINALCKDVFKNCYCAAEGDARAVACLTALLSSLGARVVTVFPDKKAAYHAAAVMASNYLATLAQNAMELLIGSGLTHKAAQEMTTQLMHSSLTNLLNNPNPREVLTGPLARGDFNTIKMHLDAIKSPDANHLYRAAALATLGLTSLDSDMIASLRSLLET
ncbi:Uncharacterized conserved protein [Legionella londiniensis]|uniref:Rossmann-like domain protein n=2 Tax=Legionella londiniensis TaxID=45068 RepID=A0A0W0VI45_9GAMM|nr:Rossmann-like domain protein [Legionella londiniensis]STX92281.1 Uncharacterized conserved protein [Legionella londiniensis]